jgi:hypothetical protein
VDPHVARGIAHYSHVGTCDPSGYLLIEHVERVAAAVCEEARTAPPYAWAWRHIQVAQDRHRDSRVAA